MTVERILNKTQRRTVLAVHGERQRLIAELGECDAALNDLAETYRTAYDLPEGEYYFEGDGNEIRIMKREKSTKAAALLPGSEEEKPAADVDVVGADDGTFEAHLD